MLNVLACQRVVTARFDQIVPNGMQRNDSADANTAVTRSLTVDAAKCVSSSFSERARCAVLLEHAIT